MNQQPAQRQRAVASSTLTTWNIDITGLSDALVDGAHGHALVSRWLDPEGGHRNTGKHWSFRGAFRRGAVTSISVSTLSPRAERALLSAACAEARVRLGREHGVIAGAPSAISRTTWAELLHEPPRDAWVIRCDTPVGFRSRNRFTPLLEPRSVTKSLLCHVNSVEPSVAQILRLDDRELGTLWVSDIDGRNVVLPVAKLTASGFVGRMRFVCEDAMAARKFGVLLRFAEIAGLGSYTTQGLGVMGLESTWPGRAFRSA